ncbi:hypothetical protein BC826DRAFT_973863 [Russula brevipes]|nr:hypothetical protein BC826DRAFT_973863 [Russula brevipes]
MVTLPCRGLVHRLATLLLTAATTRRAERLCGASSTCSAHHLPVCRASAPVRVTLQMSPTDRDTGHGDSTSSGPGPQQFGAQSIWSLRGWPRHCNRTQSRSCARLSGLHKGDRLRQRPRSSWSDSSKPRRRRPPSEFIRERLLGGVQPAQEVVDKAPQGPQLRTVETMCKTEWPAQGRPTETEVTVLTEQLEQATMEEAATRVLEGEAAREEVIVSPKGPRARVDEDEAAHVDEASKPHTVETMCKTEWPAQGRLTETEVTVLTERLERATMEKAAARVLEGEAPWEASHRRTIARGVRGQGRGSR